MESAHPWGIHLNIRRDLKITCNLEEGDQDPAPHKFNDRNLIRSPDQCRALTIRECVTLEDVVDFREKTNRQREKKGQILDDVTHSLHLEDISLDDRKTRVIYRYTDIIKDDETMAILEAIHFEIFMPDRPDLRFIALPMALLPKDSCEGDFYEIFGVEYTPNVFWMHAEVGYWLVWTVNRYNRLPRLGKPAVDYIYVTDMDKESEDRKAVCNWTTKLIRARHRRFNQTDCEKKMDVNRIYDANLVDTSSAWIYPVEPPKNREEYANLVQNVRSISHFTGTYAQEISVLSATEQNRIDDRLAEFNNFDVNMKIAEQNMISLFKLGVRFRQLSTPVLRENVFILQFDPPKLQVYTGETFYLDALTLHFDERNVKLTVDNIKRESDGRRKNTYIHCDRNSDLLRVVGPKSVNFWIDATFHADGGSPTEKILDMIDNQISMGERDDNSPFKVEETTPKMIQAVYGKNKEMTPHVPSVNCTILKGNGEELRLNAEQTRAMEMYHNVDNSGYCILSPPGSGKTTVAAAMAASLVKDKNANRRGSVQMLLAVQNVAVENLAIALKSFDDGTLRSYRLLSKVRTDSINPMPYDIFDHLPNYKRWMANAEEKDISDIEFFFNVEADWRRATENPGVLNATELDELRMMHNQAMFKAKFTLEKYMKPEIILSTVDLALFKLSEMAERGVRGQFWDVDRIIIDEASLLTESTFYCLVRCFPKASFVLIGDDKQLPPFMYDHKILGHELAGQAALTIAMRRNNLPIIQLVEVYRAPQSLIEPYNGLSYDGKLVSRKEDYYRPLFMAGLVDWNRPDLLLVDIPTGYQMGSPSPYNEKEIDVLLNVLSVFPVSMHDDIMIICLYKEQKTRVQRRLGPEYEIMTVDMSQGKEKPIVIVLTTRTEKTSEFFSNQNRCTVAVSRHQRSLIILGNNSLLSHQHPWSKVLEDFTRVGPDLIRLRDPKNPWAQQMLPKPDSHCPISFPPLNKETYSQYAVQSLKNYRPSPSSQLRSDIRHAPPQINSNQYPLLPVSQAHNPNSYHIRSPFPISYPNYPYFPSGHQFAPLVNSRPWANWY